MQIRDRIVELKRVPASAIRPNPKNWRVHPEAQQNALRGVLADVGMVDAVLAYYPSDGQGLMLVDGHLRAETLSDADVPVIILDITDEEADKVLATFDPITNLATADSAQLEALTDSLTFGNDAVADMIESLRAHAGLIVESDRPSLDDLDEEHGEEDPKLFWPDFKIKLPPETHEHLTRLMALLPGEDHEKFEALLNAVDEVELVG